MYCASSPEVLTHFKEFKVTSVLLFHAKIDVELNGIQSTKLSSSDMHISMEAFRGEETGVPSCAIDRTMTGMFTGKL